MSCDRCRGFVHARTSPRRSPIDYYSDELSTTYRLKSQDGRLMLRVGNLSWEPLDPTVPDEFVPALRQNHDNRIVKFQRNAAGNVQGLSVSLRRVRGIRFQKIE